MGYWLTISTSQSTNAANNTSTVSATLTLNSDNWSNYAGGFAAGGSITIGGNTLNFSGPTSYLYPSNPQYGSAVLANHSVTFAHDANGYRGAVGTSGSFNGGGGNAPGALSVGGTTFGAVDYDRRPGSPSFNTITRTVDDFYVSLNTVSSPVGTPTYYIQRSQNGGGWFDDRASQSTTFYDMPHGSTQQFRCAAYNSDGWTGWTYSGTYSVPTVPSAPSAIAIQSINGLDITVSISGSTSNGGSAITGYYMQYNNGGAWSSPALISGNSITYQNLTPGLSYTFRAYAVNEMGNSAFATSTQVFLSAGGRRWTGTTFTPTTTAKRFNGSEWVNLTIGKRWDGSNWVNLQ